MLYGHWMGTLLDDGLEMRVLLHISQSTGGDCTGTLDNIDVGSVGLSLECITDQGDLLRFSVPAIDGSYEGRSGHAHAIEGTWTMRNRACPLVLHPVTPSNIDGIWEGTLSWQSMRLRLRFYLATGTEGLIGAMKSCDQDEAMVPLDAVRHFESALVLESASIGARFDGVLNRDCSRVDGMWEQGGVRLPLRLKRVASEDEEEPSRPQTPSEPYPYQSVEARYRNPRAGCELAGTLTIPERSGPFPAVLLISGSGKHDRDGSMCGHKPFLVLADYLTRRGVPVLRTDDRGVGDSEGDFSRATTSDLATDAESALDWLRGRPESAGRPIGLIGHSEGGLIASMVAARDREVAFIVLLAGPGIPGWEIAGRQARRQAELYGADGETAAQMHNDLTAILRNQKDETTLRRQLEARLSSFSEAQIARMVEVYTSPWMRHFVGLDPADYLRLITCPVLAIIGTKDSFLESKSNLEVIREALESGGNRSFDGVEVPGLNHLLQTCETGSPTEYAQIEETIAPLVLEKIATWVKGQTPLR